MRKTIIVAVSALVMLSGCTGKLFQTKNDVAMVRAVPNKIVEYRILPNDKLSINVYKYPELTPTNMASSGMRVDAHGYISLPLIRRVKVAGLTESECARMLERRYRKYLMDPSLNLEVLNKRIYVLGEVGKVGPLEVDKEQMTIIEAIAMAGGMKDSSAKDNIIVISRNAANQMTMRRIDMTSFHNLNIADIIIKPNDIIYVQPNGMKTFKSVLDIVSTVASPYFMFKAIEKSID